MLLTNIPKIRIPNDDYDWLVAECRRLLAECQIEGPDGAVFYTPDTQKHYGAMWTRDLCYMVEGAGHLMPPEHIASAIDTIVAGQRDDGAIPDRVEADGTPVYLAGPKDAPLGDRPPTDNPQFIIKAIDEYLKLTNDLQFVVDRVNAMFAALESVPQTDDGAVYVDPASPHASYGFADTAQKTGAVAFSTLLLWEAWQLMGEMGRRIEDHDAAHDAYEAASKVFGSMVQFWDPEFELLIAGTYMCRQLDIWASAYAVRIGAVASAQRKGIATFLCDMYPEITMDGYVRHLVAGQYWERTLTDVPNETYQNGGYWAVPTGWVARALLSSYNPHLAERTAIDLVSSFKENGACEWIGDGEHVLPGYVASAALLLDAVKPETKRRG